MKVVIDTNVLLMSMPKVARYRPIFDGLIKGDYQLAISEDIFQEYIEIIGMKTTAQIAQNFSELLMQLENVAINKIYFRWNLIEADADDNKFVDCAISANAKYIVSNDNHFKILKNIDFPKVDVISAEEFLNQLK